MASKTPIKRKSFHRDWALSTKVMDGDSDIMARFVRACEEGDIDEIKLLLKIVSLPSFPREKLEATYRPPLYWACKKGHLEVIKLLIDHYPGSNPHLVTDKGHTLLHVACARGHVSVAYYLHSNFNVSAVEPNSHNVTPIFTATNSGHLQMVKFLIDELKCNPNTLNDSGDSLLHQACFMKHLNIVEYLIKVQCLNPELRNKFNKTPLHFACSGGSLSVVKYLVEEINCEVEIFDSAGYTPLHNACRNDHSIIVQYFVDKKYKLSLYDHSGYTPLHVACQFRRKEVVRTLLKSEKVDPNCLTVCGHSPSDITKDIATVKQLIRGGMNISGWSEIYEEYLHNYPLHSTVHVFVVGHSSSGKSTLVTALQKPRKLFKFPTTPVAPNTTGIVSIDYDGPEFGKILFYDFAGHDEYHPSHAALLEHSKFASPPLFLLLINLIDSFAELKRKINYWFQFIENHCIPKGNSPNVIVVGSHPDMLPKNCKEDLINRIQDFVKYRAAASIINYRGFYTSDCRVVNILLKLDTDILSNEYEYMVGSCFALEKIILNNWKVFFNINLSGTHFNTKFPTHFFRSALRDCCGELRNNIQVELPCHALYALLQLHFKNTFACNISDVINKAEQYDYPLPLKYHEICKLADCICSRTKHIFLRNHLELEKSWIVMDIESLFKKIHGKIFAPVGLPEHVFQPTQTGVLPWSQITGEFPDLDPTLVVAFLHRLEFCQIISDTEVLSLIEGKHDLPNYPDSNSGDDINKDGPVYKRSCSDGHQRGRQSPSPESTRYHSWEHLPQYIEDLRLETHMPLQKQYLFFPSLITPEQPSGDMWLNDSIYEHYFGWCILCSNDYEFFVLRFLQILLLRLSFKFAVSKSNSGKCNQLECTLWKNGLRWLNLNGIETIVEFIEDGKALVVLMRITGPSLMNGLHLRSALIRKILDTKNEYCSQVETEECFIHPEELKARHGYPVINRPVRDLKRYDVHLVAKAFCDCCKCTYI